MKAILVGLAFLVAGCTASHPSWSRSDVVLTITDRERGFKKEWIDTDGNKGTYEMIATYYYCNGRARSKPSTIYDVKTGRLFLEKHLVRYSGDQGGTVIPGDRRC